MIPVKRQPKARDGGLLEPCSFCFKATEYWSDSPERLPGEQVACCRSCARSRGLAALLSKDEWFKAINKRIKKSLTQGAVLERTTDLRADIDAILAVNEQHAEWEAEVLAALQHQGKMLERIADILASSVLGNQD